MKTKEASALPEKTGYTKYFEHDGALRAYANRMMWFGISAVLISFVLAILLFYVRVLAGASDARSAIAHWRGRGRDSIAGATSVREI